MPNRHNLTDEQVEQAVAAFRARMKGENYQFQNIDGDWFTVRQTDSGANWDEDTLRRPVPTKRVIPFIRDTLPALPFEVRDKAGNRYCITTALRDQVKTGQGGPWTYEELLEDFTFPDGRPCGQEVEG